MLERLLDAIDRELLYFERWLEMDKQKYWADIRGRDRQRIEVLDAIDLRKEMLNAIESQDKPFVFTDRETWEHMRSAVEENPTVSVRSGRVTVLEMEEETSLRAPSIINSSVPRGWVLVGPRYTRKTPTKNARILNISEWGAEISVTIAPEGMEIDHDW